MRGHSSGGVGEQHADPPEAKFPKSRAIAKPGSETRASCMASSESNSRDDQMEGWLTLGRTGDTILGQVLEVG